MIILENNVQDIKNPNEVNCIYVYKKGNNRCLIAKLVTGVTVQLTALEDLSSFPQNALIEYLNKVGASENYLKNFYVLNIHSSPLNTCLNKKQFIDFSYDGNGKETDIFVNFKNAISARVFTIKNYAFQAFNSLVVEKITKQKQDEMKKEV